MKQNKIVRIFVRYGRHFGLFLTCALGLAVAHILLLCYLTFGVPESEVHPAIRLLTLVLVALAAYYLEGVQQAANTASSLSRDIVEGELIDLRLKKRVIRALKGYESFSSARQFFSIAAILVFKANLDAMVPDGYSKIITFLGAKVNVGMLANSEVFLFFSSALFISCLLQLLPKRVARTEVLSFFRPIPMIFVRVLNFFGRLGAKNPVDEAEFIRSSVLGFPLTESRYGVSKTKVIDELGQKFGFTVEHINLVFVIGEEVKLHEKATLKVTNSMSEIADNGRRTRLTHTVSLFGDWTHFASDSSVKHSNRLTTATYITEESKEILESPHRDTSDEIVDTSDDTENQEFRTTKRTKFETSINFPGAKSLPDPGTNLIFERSALFDEGFNGANAPIRHLFKFGVESPARKLTVTIVSKRDILPSNCELKYQNAVKEVEFSTSEFDVVECDSLLPAQRGYHAVRASIYLPYFGNTLELATFC